MYVADDVGLAAAAEVLNRAVAARLTLTSDRPVSVYVSF